MAHAEVGQRAGHGQDKAHPHHTVGEKSVAQRDGKGRVGCSAAIRCLSIGDLRMRRGRARTRHNRRATTVSELGEGWAGVDGPRGAVLHGRATKVAGPLGSTTRGAALPPTWASIHISHKQVRASRALKITFKCVKRLVNQPGYQFLSRVGKAASGTGGSLSKTCALTQRCLLACCRAADYHGVFSTAHSYRQAGGSHARPTSLFSRPANW